MKGPKTNNTASVLNQNSFTMLAVLLYVFRSLHSTLFEFCNNVIKQI